MIEIHFAITHYRNCHFEITMKVFEDKSTAAIVAIFANVLATSVLAIHLSYEQLEELGAACPPEDSCAAPRDIESDSLSNYRCECKASCVKYGTCCIDSPNNNILESKVSDVNVKGNCELVINSDIWTNVVSKCEDGWTGDDFFKSKCENPILNFRDAASIRPVTSLKSEVTYKNYFCAICNEDAHFSRTWSTIFEDEDDEIIWDEDYETNFAEEDSENEKSRSRDNTALAKKFTVYFPPSLTGIVHSCLPNLVSDCDESWTNDTIRNMCKAYMAVKYIIPEGESVPLSYRNIHCAICNYQNQTQESCASSRTKRQLRSKHFSLLFPQKNTEKDGVPSDTQSCSQGEVFDSFFKKCRKPTCTLPGFKIINGKCTKVPTTTIPPKSNGPSLPSSYFVLGGRSIRTDNIHSCSQGEVYDIFTKKCRKPICSIPGFELIGGKCKPINNTNEEMENKKLVNE